LRNATLAVQINVNREIERGWFLMVFGDFGYLADLNKVSTAKIWTLYVHVSEIETITIVSVELWQNGETP
jgi:hypothetical protein